MNDDMLNRELSIPLHYQLMLILKDRIKSGVYAAGSQIPNEMQLCSEFKVSRPTVRKAVEELVGEGLLVKIHPKGTFVQGEFMSDTAVEEESVSPISDRTLTVSFEVPLLDVYLFQAVEEFEYRMNCKVHVEQRGAWKEGISGVVNTIINNRVPDIFLLSNAAVPAFAQMGILQSFDSFLGREKAEEMKRMEKDVNYGEYLYQNMLYGHPFFSETRLMYYRKDHFDALGLAYPDHSWTHEDFLEICHQLTDPKNVRWGYAFPAALDGDTLQTMMTWIMQRGGELCSVDDNKVKPSTESKEFAEGFQWLCDLVLKHGVCPPVEKAYDYSELCMKFIDGQISMLVGLPSFSIVLSGRLEGKWGVVSLPHGSAGNKSYRGRMPLCMSSRCKNPGLAWEFIQYITSKQILFPYTKRIGVLPPEELFTREEILTDIPDGLKIFAEQMDHTVGWMDHGSVTNAGIEMEVWQMPVQYALLRVLRGKLSYEGAIKYITLALKNILNK